MKISLSRALLALLPLSLLACANPTSDEALDDAVAVDDSASPNAIIRPIYLPDFVVVPYAGRSGCRDAAHKLHYRFYLENKGTAAGTVPMTKIHIWKPESNNDALLDYTTYVWSTSLAVGEKKLIDLVLPYDAYPTWYQAEVRADVAGVVSEWNETNNELVEQINFWNGVGPAVTCD